MMSLVRVVAFLHLAVYLGIMWYGWQSYKLLRKRSWRFMGVGFGVLLLYRVREFISQVIAEHPTDSENTLIPFIGSVFLLVAFKMLSTEHHGLIKMLAAPAMLRSGAQPVEFWLENFRVIVREEIAATRTTLTVTGPVVEKPPTKESGL